MRCIELKVNGIRQYKDGKPVLDEAEKNSKVRT